MVGVSRSRPFTHRQFIDLLDLGFPPYSDTTMDVSAAYGVDYRALKLVRRPLRSCFLVDSDRRIRYRWVADHDLDPTVELPDVGEINRAVVEAVCGADADSFGFS